MVPPHASGRLCRLAAVALLVGGCQLVGWQLVGWTDGARAQIQLPGALNGAPAAAEKGTPAAPPVDKGPAKPLPVRTPADEAVLGHPLALDGTRGALRFERGTAGIVLGKLTLPGERLSKAGQPCTVDIVTTPAIAVEDRGHPAGAQRWRVPIPACPFTADVLDGAVLVTSAQAPCDVVAADCRVDPVGLWGPAPDTIGPAQMKDLERERVRAETTIRANYKALIRRAGKDRVAIKAIAREQAAFSSQREVTCRDYARETVHGFCSTQITAARSLALLAAFPDGAALAAKHGTKPASERRAARKTPPAAAKPVGVAPKPASDPAAPE